MNIGEVWAALRIDGSKTAADATKAGTTAGGAAGTAASKSFGQKFKAAYSGSELQKGLFAGLGLAGGLGAATLVAKAIGAVTDALGDSVKAAREEQLSVAKLDAALEANVDSWNGNTDAIEAALQARMKLGFADDEQRDSLAQLLVVTKDATKALDVQRAAMDLARLRNMSLADASALLGKVYGGNVGVLRRYGFQLAKGTTATEALAEVQRAAGGQAEAWAEKNKKAVADVRIGEAMETIGLALIPVVDGLAGLAADVIPVVIAGLGNLGDAFNNINRFIDPGVAAVQDFEEAVRAKAKAMGYDATQTLAWVQAEERRAAAERERARTTAAIADIERRMAEATANATLEIEDYKAAIEAGGDAETYNNIIMERKLQLNIQLAPLMTEKNRLLGIEAEQQAAVAKASDITTEAERRAEEALKAYTAEQERSAQSAAILTGAWTGLGETAEETGKVIHAGLVKPVKRAFGEMFQSMAEAKEPWKAQWRDLAAWAKDPFSKKNFADYIDGRIDKAMERARKTFGKERRRWLEIARAYRWIAKQEWIDPMTADLQAIMEGLRVASRMTKGAAKTVIEGTDWRLPGNNASGTPYWRGGWSWVGEQGPELVRLPRGTAIQPHEQSMATAAASMSGQVVEHIHRADRATVQIAKDMGVPLGDVLLAAQQTAGTRYTSPRRFGG